MAKKQFGKWVFTEEDLNGLFEKASILGEKDDQREPEAKRVYYDGNHRTLALELADGSYVARPVADIQGLSQASPSQIAQVTLTPSGDILQWDNLKLDLSVAGLVQGILGSRSWMAELGRRGGRVSTEAKAAAARENGRRGGRPRKVYAMAAAAVSVKATILQAVDDLIIARVAGGSHQATANLAKYETGLNNAQRAVKAQVLGLSKGQFLEERTSYLAPVLTNTSGQNVEEANEYAAFPVAA